MRAAAVQLNANEDTDRNLERADRLVREAVARGAELVVLPEKWTVLGTREHMAAGAQSLDGEAISWARSTAAQLGIDLVAGSLFERVEDAEKGFNTSVHVGPDGEIQSVYRKIHLFDVVTPDGKEYRESAAVGRGSEIVTYQLEGHTVGCSICYDMRFPELYQALAKQGAEIIVVPSAFTLQTGKDHWEPLLRARAIETETYVLAAAQTGGFAQGRRLHYGHSLVADPWGHVIAKAQDKVGFVTARLDFDFLRDVRARIPVQQHKVL